MTDPRPPGLALDQGYKPRSTARFLSGLRGFFRYLLREKLVAVDPTLQVDMPQLGKPLPKSLSEADVEALLQAPDLGEASASATAPCSKCSMRAACASPSWSA